LFFFSSRRRHTRCYRDWSSDVCSSDLFNSEEEMLTKLRTNPGTYDVVLINSARTLQAQAEDLLEPIDLSKVPNAKDLAPQLRDRSEERRVGKEGRSRWTQRSEKRNSRA